MNPIRLLKRKTQLDEQNAQYKFVFSNNQGETEVYNGNVILHNDSFYNQIRQRASALGIPIRVEQNGNIRITSNVLGLYHIIMIDLGFNRVEEARGYINSCIQCNSKATHACGDCLEAKYCGKDCQKVHWSTHQKECLGAQARSGKVAHVMREFKHHELHSGSKHGPIVTSKKQAMAIALSEARGK